MTARKALAKPRFPRRATDEQQITFALPMPPSTNHLFFNVKGRGRVTSGEYDAWKREAALMVQAQKVLRLDGRVAVEIRVEDAYPQRDADNTIKPILDLISSADINIIAGDSAKHVRRVCSEWSDVKDAVVTVRRAL